MEISIPWNSNTVIMCLAVTVAVYMLMWFVKRTLENAKASFRNKPWVRGYILTPLPIVLGALIGFIPGVVPGDGLGSRLFFGSLCGMLSVIVRNVLKNRAGIMLPEMPRAVTEEKKDGGPDKP